MKIAGSSRAHGGRGGHHSDYVNGSAEGLAVAKGCSRPMATHPQYHLVEGSRNKISLTSKWTA